MNGSPMHRNFGIGDQDKKAARKEKRAQRRRDRLAKKGKLIASESMSPGFWEGEYDVKEGGVHSSVTDPKGVVVKMPTTSIFQDPIRGSSTQYKVSRKGKIKKEV